MKKNNKKVVFSILSLIVGIIIAFVILEISLRLFFDFSNTACGIMEKDRYLGVKFKPNLNLKIKTQEFNMHLQTNSQGFKDREYENKKDNEYRILALGDSFTEGAVEELNQTYVKILESLLNNKFRENTSKTISVINTGISGYGANQERILLEKYGLQMKPDAVIMFFYLNDPESDYAQINDIDVTVDKDDCVISTYSLNQSKFSWRELNNFLLKHSKAYYFTKVISPNFPIIKNTLYPLRNLLVKINFSEPPELRYFILKSNYSDYDAKAFEASLKNIEWVKNITDIKKVKFTLVMIPMKFQVYEDLWKDYKERNLILDGKYDFNKPSKILSEFSKLKNITFIDLLPILQDKIKNKNLNQSIYYDNDPHFNLYGNEVVGKSLFEKLIQFI